MSRSISLFEAATQRSRILRQGDLTQIIIDGGGALVVMTQDYIPVQKWAQSKAASQNALTDRGRFLEQLPALVSRPGTQASTRGSTKQLEALARTMKQGGYDLSEWNLPPELKQAPVIAPLPAKPQTDAPESEAPE